ncbi:MAG TPA: hypothetical protein VN721_02300 [Flavipsychrobacter sp.]|nr:hypothetical protein [Flavipsychrobacter sp.]
MDDKYFIKTITVLICFISCAFITDAQVTKVRSGKNEMPPKAILVQINTESNKIKYLLDHGMTEDADEVKNDVEKVTEATRNDFKANFSFCTVYFFADTNMNLIKEKKFDEVLFNNDGSIAKNIVITPADTNYYIAMYGHAYSNPGVTHANNQVQKDPSYLYGKGLVMLNYQFKQLPPNTFHYLFKFDYFDFFVKRDPRYSYSSKRFDIEYYQSAKRLNKLITEYFSTPHNTYSK